MTEKNTAALIIVALIGAVGVILAACIGLIPTILPMVRPTFTPFVFPTPTFPASDTPAPETPSATPAPTDLPTSTVTDTPFVTDTPASTESTPDIVTITPTFEAASSNVDDYVGTWVNVDDQPKSAKVKLIVTRMEINKTGGTTAEFSACRATQGPDTYVAPHPAQATVYEFGMVARDLTTSRFPNLKWSVIVQQSADQLVATVQEYDSNNVLLNSDIFRFQKQGLLGSITLEPCQEPSP
jgi:hypothetical protein